MKRLHLFEIHDQVWCPADIRLLTTEFLANSTRLTKLWRPTGAVLEKLLQRTTEKRIVVLGAGSGGGIIDVMSHLPSDIEVVLTDLYPPARFQNTNPRIKYISESVDATAVPKNLTGLRVMYASFHHLNPKMAKQVLENAVNDNQAIAIFEITERSMKGFLAILLVPFMVLLTTPLIYPWRWDRFLFTYLIPILPLIGLWDGFVSALRTYSAQDLEELVQDFTNYDWTIQVLKGPHKERLPTLIGAPKS